MSSTATAEPRNQKRRSYQGTIRRISIDRLRQSPENRQLYRPVDPDDPEIIALAKSIAYRGVQEPLIATKDHYLVSGHRRLVAATLAGLATVPCKVLPWERFDRPDKFLRLLRECNRQRVKSYDEALREQAIDADPDVAYQALIEHRSNRSIRTGDALKIRGTKTRAEITKAKMPLLEAVQAIVEERRKYWPLTDRQIHYALLNDPPLIHASKPDSTYRNDAASYRAVVDICTRGRLADEIPMEAIGDETRPVQTWNIHQTTASYLRREMDNFCMAYWRDLIQSQPNQIEIVCEKNTVRSILSSVAARYCLPITSGRGYCSLPPRHAIAERYRKSGKDRLVLLIVSDFDPEGEDIPHSLALSMRDDFGIMKIDAIKVALTAEQVDVMELPPVCTAKTEGMQYERFFEQHGNHTWELEALSPATLQDLLTKAIDDALDIEAFNHEIDREREDAAHLAVVRGVFLKMMRAFDATEAGQR